MQMNKGLLISQNTFENSIFLNLWVPEDEIFFKTFVYLYFSRSMYANTSWHLSHWVLLSRGGQTKASVWFGCPLLLSGALSHPHLGHSLHVHHLLFRTPSLATGWDHEFHPGRKNRTQQGRMGRLVVVGNKCSAGEETNQQNLGIRNHFWSTYLNRSPSDVEQSKKGDR